MPSLLIVAELPYRCQKAEWPKGGCWNIWTAIQDIVDFLLNHQFVNECANGWGPIGLYQIGDAIFLIDDATFRVQSRSARHSGRSLWLAQEENLPFKAGAVIVVIIRWSSCPGSARLGYVSVLPQGLPSVIVSKVMRSLSRNWLKGVVVSFLIVWRSFWLTNWNYFGAHEWTGFAIWWPASQWGDIQGIIPDNFYLNLGFASCLLLLVVLGFPRQISSGWTKESCHYDYANEW